MLFTKSRFKMALECPTKLWYNQKANQETYKNTLPENLFLQFLADNGHAIGEYAKFLYHDSPLNPDITVRDHGYEASVADTNRRLVDDIDSGIHRSIIAEAAIRYDNYFIRVDILIADHVERTLTLVEVKAKSASIDEVSSGFKSKNGFIPKWCPYLYDVAFQTIVTELALETMLNGKLKHYRVIPKLVLINKDEICDLSGLNEFVKVIRNPIDGKQIKIQLREGTTRADLGSLGIFIEVPMQEIVEELRSNPLPDQYSYIPIQHRKSLMDFMHYANEVHRDNLLVYLRPDKRCKDCQFKARQGDPENSGVHECFANAIQVGWFNGNPNDAMQRKKPLATELWGGKAGSKSIVNEVLNNEYAFVEDISFELIGTPKTVTHFSPYDRRKIQIQFARGVINGFKIHHEALQRHINSWNWPLHMIDFETTAPGIPYFEGMHPYQLVAFQFSHHVMDSDGSIHHADQFIDVDSTGNPNIQFVRALRNALMPSGELNGTVFMYSKHERTTLKAIRGTIDSSSEHNRDELLHFIDLLCSENSPNRMVDLLEVVLETYISKHAGGSNSLKQVLPAILNDAPKTAAYFSIPGKYGVGMEMNSLNFSIPGGHTWLTEQSNWDPYKTLPPIFDIPEFENQELDEQLLGFISNDGGTIDQGGLAMAAYNFTRYTTLGEVERSRLRDGLLRYCELDTLAMCMLARGLMELGGS